LQELQSDVPFVPNSSWSGKLLAFLIWLVF
jgi:hypothetical protein